MKHRKECEKCFYLTGTLIVETGEHGPNICGWDNKRFEGESKSKCTRFEHIARHVYSPSDPIIDRNTPHAKHCRSSRW